MLARGILTLGVHLINYCHSDDDLEKLFNAYDEVIPLIAKSVKKKNLEKLINCSILEPLFSVR